MTPDGKAIMATPNNEESMETTRPISVTGHKSPQPTVVKVTVAQQSASKNELKVTAPVSGFYVWFGIEHYKSRNEDIKKSKHQY